MFTAPELPLKSFTLSDRAEMMLTLMRPGDGW